MSSCLPVAAIILAAGAATRMGQLKQLLPYRGKTLLSGTIEKARAAEFSPILVVVGAHAELVRASIATERVTVVQNSNWEQGMGSSIAAGIRQLQLESDDSAAVAILLGDQPLVRAHHLSSMRARLSQTSAAIIAAEYSGTVGVPAVFRRALFGVLQQLPPSAGARRLFSDPNLKVDRFALPEAAMDIDTPEDWAALEAGV